MTGAGSPEAILERIDGWGAEHASAAVIGPTGILAAHGDPRHRYPWASVTKLVTALTVLIGAERGLLALDEPAGPPGATIRHLLAHAAGLAFEGDAILARPGSHRIYSNPGFDALGALVADRAGVPFAVALGEWVLEPLGMSGTTLVERPSQGLHGPLDDLVAFARELLRPTLLPAKTLATATRVAFPGLPGVVPGVGRFDPCDWGLGFELHDAKAPHWMGGRNSPEAYGHFGGAGTFLWVDPVADVALVVLTDREFGPWSLEAWPALSDAVLATLGW
ncbi:MAG: serine hydrolase domain-containing protein [Candidatus Limnocylindrales bacterium]|nr:serine hydrolase domain-containing protein [Candidatus Limnocylindrales bacterium]